MTRYFPKKSIRSAAVSDSAPTTSLPGFDGLYGHQVHLILATEAATELFELMGAIIAPESGDP